MIEAVKRPTLLLMLALFLLGVQLSLSAHSQDNQTVHGTEWASAVNLVERDVKVEGSLFVPAGVAKIRAVVVVMRFGLGGNSCCYYDVQWRQLVRRTGAGLLLARFSSISSESTVGPWRDATLGGAEALSVLLGRLAADSSHPEVQEAPLLFWGHSAAGPFGTTYAAVSPDRTLGFIRYHSGLRGADMSVVSRVPALFLMGGKDTVAGIADGESLWKSGRAMDAPWTFAIEPDATHGEVSDAEKSNALLIPWVDAVFRLRLGDQGLKPLSMETAWFGDLATGEVAPASSFIGQKAAASWLPDEASARGWQVVTGAK